MKRLFALASALFLLTGCSSNGVVPEDASNNDLEPYVEEVEKAIEAPIELFTDTGFQTENDLMSATGLITHIYENTINLETEDGMLTLEDYYDIVSTLNVGDFGTLEFKYRGYSPKHHSPFGSLQSANITDSRPDTYFYRTDFFSDEGRRSQYAALLDCAKYSELKSLVESYTSTSENLQSVDSANTILQILNDAVPLLDSCIISTDPFDGSTHIRHQDVTALSNQVFVVPTLSKNDFSAIFGFYRSDWLFFDQLQIKYDDEIVKVDFPSYNITREVVASSRILEQVSYAADHDKVLSANTISLRFLNTKTEESVDHNLSSSELDALKTLYSLKDVYSNLSNIAFQYKQAHSLL